MLFYSKTIMKDKIQQQSNENHIYYFKNLASVLLEMKSFYTDF